MCILLALLLAGVSAFAGVSVTDLRCEDLVNPLGIDVAKPRLSWRMVARDQKSEVRGQRQTAYQVIVASSPELLAKNKGDLWDSGKVKSDESRFIKYEGKDISRGIKAYWMVKVWDQDGKAAESSGAAWWTYFDMTSNDKWQAKWITFNTSSPWMRRSMEIKAVPKRAYIYVNALGYFQLFINGKRVGSDEFAPHVGQYDKRTFCITYDVTKYLKKGKNAVGIWMGSGWNQGGAGVKSTPCVRAQLEMVDAGDKTSTFVTDETWRAKPSFMTYRGSWAWYKFGGEVHDATREEPRWADADYEESAWPMATLTNVAAPLASAEMLQRSRVIETIKPGSVKSIRSGVWLVDMGKAMTGTFEITFPKAEKGHKISMKFGDKLNMRKKGGIPGVNSFSQTSDYICRGSGKEVFRNRFNYASCRYILILNAPEGEITPEDIEGRLITTVLPKASTFECSDETLNKIYGMMEHTLRCLMLGGYQVDCHSRERYGYGGDGHSSLDTTLCLFRSDAFYRKWTLDWLDQQKPDGVLTHTSPASAHGGGPFWCGFLPAATLKHYHHYGDLSMVERNYPVIKKWFERAQRKTVDGIQRKFTGQKWYLGDWASPKGVKDKWNAETFIQPYMVYALKQAAELADILGKTDDASQFRSWAKERSLATHKKFYDPQGKKYGSGDQVTYILPLAADVVPGELREEVLAGFEKTLKEKNKGHLTTGLSGTYMMVQYLQKIGRDDLIYLFASKKTYPSWGYMIEKGATATWEYWGGQHSRIHNCYNNIGSWFIQGLGGIRPDPKAPGFKNAIIKPAFLKEISYVNCSHDSVYGTIQSNWKREDDKIIMNIKVPANTTATVYVPGEKKPRQVGSGEYTFEGKW